MFRQVEADLLDRFLAGLSETNMRPVLPLYDGALVAVPTDELAQAEEALKAIGAAAAVQVGVPTSLQVKFISVVGD